MLPIFIFSDFSLFPNFLSSLPPPDVSYYFNYEYICVGGDMHS